MSKQSSRKLVEILAEELKQWPECVYGCDSITQDKDGSLNSTDTGEQPEFVDGSTWHVYASTYIEFSGEVVRKELASDYKTAIVTREMWEAERAKLEGEKVMRACVEKCEPEIKPKSNAQGWVRNRGRKNPFDVCTLVDARLRSGEVVTGKFSDNLKFVHTGGLLDVMAYRVNESVEAAAPEVTAQNDGPLQWRDRITEIDRTVDALVEERASLIQKLADEGFKLIKREAVDMKAQDKPKDEAASLPTHEWQVGDILLACGDCGGFDFAGELVKIIEIVDGGGVKVATSYEPDYVWYFTETEVETDLRFHSRPTK